MSEASPISVDLEATLEALVVDAIRENFDDAPSDLQAVVRPSKFADYQVNGALALAKQMDKNPRELAEAIARNLLHHSDVIQSADVAGPGFINVTFTNTYLSSVAMVQLEDERLGRSSVAEPLNIVVDYGGPNVAKEMHVGHLRSTVIGDSITRVLQSQGHTTIKQNHLGDWGTQFGMLIEHLMEDPAVASGVAELKVDELESIYRAARKHFDEDDAFKERARERVVALQQGDKRSLDFWNLLVEESKRHFDEVFDGLDTLLTDDDYRGESMYNDMLDDTVEQLDRKGLLVESEGAMCVFPEGFKGKEGDPLPLIVRKTNGGYGYAATDLAALRYNAEIDNANLTLYVTDGRQSQHFAMLIAVSKMAGWLDEQRDALHVPHGTVMGKDGKPFKTRTGGTVRLIELLTEAKDKAAAVLDERGADFEGDDRQTVVDAVALAALKWADLKNDRTSNYVFDIDAMTSFEGNTGPYVQYACTRAKSVLRKAEGIAAGEVVIDEAAERELVLHLAAYNDAVERTANEYEPHHICTYLFELAGRFSSFYESCPVLVASTAEIRASRLALCTLTARVLEDGLSMLGIRSLERM